jgi:hypothetical protein
MDKQDSDLSARDAMTAVAEEICSLWAACGGSGPPHEFDADRWAKGTKEIAERHGLTPREWQQAHMRAVKMGARRGGAGV